jgi:hypothetical protein
MGLLLGFGVKSSAEDVHSDDGQYEWNETDHGDVLDPVSEDFHREFFVASQAFPNAHFIHACFGGATSASKIVWNEPSQADPA